MAHPLDFWGGGGGMTFVGGQAFVSSGSTAAATCVWQLGMQIDATHERIAETSS